MRLAFVALFAAPLLGGCKGHGVADDAGPDNYAPQVAPTSSTPANASPLPAERVEAYVNPSHLPPYKGETGSVEGTVVVSGDPSPNTIHRDYSKCPEGAEGYRKLFREGPARPDGSRPVADALVVVTGYSGGYLPEQKPSRLVTIDDCVVSTRTIDLTIGQKLEVQNLMKDKVFSPAFLQTPSGLGLVAPPGGDPVSLYPQAPGILTLFDRFGAGSAYLTADVYVLVQSLHAVTDAAGHYRIDGIPVGDVKVNALLGVVDRKTTKPVTVRANLVEPLDLEIHYEKPKMPVLAQPSPSADAGRRHGILK